ncbi:MAG: hypothetical protein D3907_15895, partial [Candidatus Electrothrix sp. AUS3]|nr:hypothetical protein [Candidatus Electrothrix gigas]
GVSIDEAALNMVVREAGGSVRDGLSLLDQVFSYCGDKVTGPEVADVLGLVSHEVIADLACALLAKDLNAALKNLDQVYSYGMDIKRFINELLAWFRSLVVCSISKNPAVLLDLPADELALLQKVAGTHSSQTLFMMFNLLLEGLEKAAYAARPRFAVEMTFIRAVQVDEVLPVTDLLMRLDDVLAGVPLPQQQVPQGGQGEREKVLKVLKEPKPTTTSSSPSLQSGTSAATPALAEKKDDEPVTPSQQALPPDNQEKIQKVQSEPITQQKSEQNPPPPEDTYTPVLSGQHKRDVRKHWPEFTHYVQERIQWMGAALKASSSACLENSVLTVHYD